MVNDFIRKLIKKQKTKNINNNNTSIKNIEKI